MLHLPIYIPIIFSFAVLLAFAFFFKASHYSKAFLSLAVGLILIQSLVGISGFYTVTSTVTTRLPLLVVPQMIVIVILFTTKRGNQFVKSFDVKTLTLLHIVRIPVELTLFWLATYKAVPYLMTFKGGNFDIVSGLTAPVIYYFGFVQKKLGKWVLVCWNIVCLGLLVNVVGEAVLSAPTPFQRFAFDQPNIAIGYFPFVLLPAFVVPLVLFAHLATLKNLIKTQ